MPLSPKPEAGAAPSPAAAAAEPRTFEGAYRELCQREGWEALHWTAIARQLGRITARKSVRDNGERFIGYQIPTR